MKLCCHLIIFLSLTSCALFQPRSINDFPLEPSLKPYERAPIIKSVDDDFLVSSDFVFNSVSLKEYSDKIAKWKEKNQVR